MITRTKRFWYCLLAALGLTALRPIAHANPAADTFQPRAEPFGNSLCVQTKFVQGQPQSDLSMLTDLSVHWVRDSASWPELEPQAGKFVSFSPALRERLAFYKKHDIGIVFLLGLDNKRAYPNTPEHPNNSIDPVAFARYASHVTKQLRASGVRFVLELWNEPHNDSFMLRKMLGGGWQGKPPSPWVDHYVLLARETVKAVRAIDPTVKVLTDDDMWIIHYWYLEAGLPKQLDGFALHPYTNGLPPEITAVAHDADWTQPFQVVDPDRSFRSAVQRLRLHAQKKLGKVPSLWFTEWGWETGGKSPTGPLTEAQIASYLPRAYVLAAAAGVTATCWFSLIDSVDGPMGLKTNDGALRQQYFALRTLAGELGKFRLVSHSIGAKSPTKGLQAFTFKSGNTTKLIAWSVDKDIPLDVSAASAKGLNARNTFGQLIVPETLPGGALRFTIGQSPIYFEGPGAATIQPQP